MQLTPEQAAQLAPDQKALLEFLIAYDDFTFRLTDLSNAATFALMCITDPALRQSLIEMHEKHKAFQDLCRKQHETNISKN